MLVFVTDAPRTAPAACMNARRVGFIVNLLETADDADHDLPQTTRISRITILPQISWMARIIYFGRPGSPARWPGCA
jgi:hypothetical protein